MTPTPPPGCRADIAGATRSGSPDGRVDAIDFLVLMRQWGTPCGGDCAADITGVHDAPDGNVDASDFVLMLSEWGCR
jgi:hypothetical protein